MRTHDIMTAAPLTCRPDTNLAEVAHLMWQGDCGIIPVVDDDGTVTGVITDRDICIAAATRDQAPSYIRAATLARTPVVCCGGEAAIEEALSLMKQHRLRRLPIVDANRRLLGILSLNDVILEVHEAGTGSVTPAAVIDVLQGICAHHRAPAVAPAAVTSRATPSARRRTSATAAQSTRASTRAVAADARRSSTS